MDRQVLPFVAPFLVFSLFLFGESFAPAQHYLIYPFKTLAVAAVIAWYWKELPSLRINRPGISILVGILGVALWIGLAQFPWLVHYPHPLIGRDPFDLYSSSTAWLLFTFRVLGIAICVPILEELFWRGFLMRWLIHEDFTKVPIGTYRPLSFFLTTALFAAEHGTEWPLGLIVGLLYGAWFIRIKTLGDIMLAHGVTNFLLAVYCLTHNDWHFLSTVDVPNK